MTFFAALAILPAIALTTTRIEIGTGILNPYTLHPGEIAMFAATMDEMSGKRFNLGLAAGAGEFLKWVGIAERHWRRADDRGHPQAAIRRPCCARRPFLHWSTEAYLRFAAPLHAHLSGGHGSQELALAGELPRAPLPYSPPERYFGVLPI
jgi:5,10-methylenetetrahydromethanopterin reductase